VKSDLNIKSGILKKKAVILILVVAVHAFLAKIKTIAKEI
jgi:hypothetical protein